MAEFKDMLSYYRQLHGFSQRDLAKRIGVSASTIGMYESGKRFPKPELEEALADLFNVSLNNLRGIDEERVPVPAYDKDIQEWSVLLPKLTADQKESLLQTARLFAQMNEVK